MKPVKKHFDEKGKEQHNNKLGSDSSEYLDLLDLWRIFGMESDRRRIEVNTDYVKSRGVKYIHVK